MLNVRADGRLGAMQIGDVYGSRYGPTTEQIGARAAVVAGAPSGSAPVVTDSHAAIAAFLLTTPAGVALLIAAGLIILSLRD